MPLCFAYGSNMDLPAMTARCPGSRALGLARLPGHRLVIMREGYASVLRHPRRQVWGLLWEVALADMPALDRYEDVAGGLYVKRLLSVLMSEGARRALVYVGRNAGPGTPRPGYVSGVLSAGRAAGLPPDYLTSVAALGGAGVAEPRPPQQKVRPRHASPLARDSVADRKERPWTP